MPLSLEEMLGEKPATPAPAAAEAPQTGESAQPVIPQDKPAEAAPAPATGQPTGEKTDGAPPAPTPDPQDATRETRAFQRAAEDERNKRQVIERERDDLKRRAADLEAYVQRVQQAQKPAPQPRPDFLDPEGVNYLQGYLQQTLQDRDAAWGQRLLETKVVQSQQMMRAQHADYDEIEAVFADAMNQNPSLHREMQEHPAPAVYAYQVGKRLKVMQAMGDDPEAYINQRVEEVLAKRQAAEPAPQPKPLTPTAPPPPPSLAGVPSASTRIAQTWQGPTSLDDLLSQPINRRR